MYDILSNPINPGDWVALPMRQKSALWLAARQVTRIEEGRGAFYYRTLRGTEQRSVSDCILLPADYDGGMFG